MVSEDKKRDSYHFKKRDKRSNIFCLKSNGGAQRFPQAGRKSAGECKGIRELDCKTYKSSRGESRS